MRDNKAETTLTAAVMKLNDDITIHEWQWQ